MHKWTKRALTGLAVVTAGLWSTAWMLSQPVAAAHSLDKAATSHSASRIASPFHTGRTVDWRQPVLTLAGHRATLARGSRATIIMGMASWCLYCGYEDRWVLPTLAREPGVVVDIVDVSPHGGIADPGPESPPFHGHDGQGGPMTASGMEQTMRQYARTYHLAGAALHVYVAPAATQKLWAVPSFPALAFVNRQGVVVVSPAGAQTLSEARADLAQAAR